MQQRFHVFTRRYDDGWAAMSVLTHPRYTVVGRHLGHMRDELQETLARDRALEILPREPTFFEGLEVEQMDLQLPAVQHDRLVDVPLTFTLAIHPEGDAAEDRWTVHVPRLALRFSLRGRSYLETWCRERIRGALHLEPIHKLLALRPAPRERVDPLLVRWHGTSRYTKMLDAPARRVSKALEIEARPSLAGVGVDLVHEARDGRLPRALSRAKEVDRLVATLGRPRQRHALLVGDAGVGKTALVHELAHRIAAGRVPERLEGVPVWFVSGNALMAGMRWLGQWQERALDIARSLQSGGGILFVGGLLGLVQAGSGRGGLNAGQLFLPFLQRDAFPFVAEVTPDALVRAEQIHAPLVRSLQRIEIRGMDRPTAHSVLEVLGQRMARGSRCTLASDALPTALEVLARYGQADALPGSGIGLLERMIKAHHGATVGRREAIDAFAEVSGFPADLIDPDAPLDEAAVHGHFTRRVVGQPAAADVLTRLILVLKAGLADPGKPLGSVLLLGPTGVGKTESAKALAAWLFGDDDRLVRLDMSEFAGLGAARRLVDGPGGQGILTRRVREQPFGVVLFDEIEKAEPGVFDVLLQVLGEGRLTDGTGVTVSFRHTIVLLTSNLGAGAAPRVGLVAPSVEEQARGYRKAAEAFFRPEFVNRLDALVPFAALTPPVIRTIARSLLGEALAREGFTRRRVTVTWGDDVLDHLVAVGFDAKLGARLMRRAIETQVLAPLSRLLAKGDVAGRELRLQARDGRVEVVG